MKKKLISIEKKNHNLYKKGCVFKKIFLLQKLSKSKQLRLNNL